VTLTAESGARVHERDVDGVLAQRVRIDARLDIALEDADAPTPLQLGERPAQERGLACARGRHEVHAAHAGRSEVGSVLGGDAVVLGEDVLEYHHALGTGRVPPVVADVGMGVIVVVLVLVHGPVGMMVEPSHQVTPLDLVDWSASSIDTSRNSSPASSSTSVVPQVPHTRIGTPSALCAPQARHATTAGTCSIASSQPSSAVPSVIIDHANVSASGTT